MVLWIESQDAAVIGLLVFGICYAFALLILAGAVVLGRRRVALDLKATTPTMLTPLAVIAGLLIAFLAAHVWSTLDRAKALIGQEASAISETVMLADTLSTEVGRSVRGDVTRYLHFVETRDWPAMGSGAATLAESPPGLTEATDTLLAFAPTTPGQRIAQERSVAAVEQVLEARRQRVLLSRATIAPIQWLVVVVLVALLLVMMAMVHLDRPRTVAINLFIFSTAVAACLVLLMVNDRPFASGGFTIQPDVLREAGVK
jgi:hypothetical protein